MTACWGSSCGVCENSDTFVKSKFYSNRFSSVVKATIGSSSGVHGPLTGDGSTNTDLDLIPGGPVGTGQLITHVPAEG